MGEICCLEPSLQDIAALVDLDRRSLGGLWSGATYGQEIASPNSCLRMLTSSALPSPCVIGLGCYWAILEEAHLTLLAIEPTYQRRGLGQWLLSQLLMEARQQGLQRATLEVRCSNQGAILLYQGFGFQALGRRRRYYADGEDALVLWQQALQSAEFQARLVECRDLSRHRLAQQGWTLKG